MAEQTHNTDMSDEPDRQDLEDRVEQLESTISKMLPSRRDALKLGGAALVGGAAMSGSASAGTQQAGTIGTAGEPVDVESEDINNAETVTTQDLVVNGSVNGLNSPFDNKVFEDNGNHDTISITGMNLNQKDALIVSLSGQSNNPEPLFMSVNSNTSDSYETIHTDGSSSISSSGFELLTATLSSASFAGNITLQKAGGARLGGNGPIAAGQYGRIPRTFLSGGLDQTAWPITSVEFNSPGSYNLQNVTAYKYSLG